MANILILHGRDGVGNVDHHQLWLARQMENEGYSVQFPILKGMHSLDFDECLREFQGLIDEYEPRWVACHSLAVQTFIHLLARNPDLHFEKALFAAPSRFDPPRELFLQFYPVPTIRLESRIGSVFLAMARNDEYRTVSEGEYIERFLDTSAHWYDHGGHLNGVEGFGAWPEALGFFLS